jgi:exonuclease SbcC
VEVEFQLGSSDYRIERFVAGDAKLWINGQLETQKVSDTNARIAQELDLTWDVFQRTVFAQQKDIAALDPGATADQRKSHVERLLGLERFKNAATRARSDMKLRSAELGTLRETAPDPQSIATALEEAEEKAAESDPAVATANAELEAKTKARDEAHELLEAEQDRRRTFEVLCERRTTEQKALNEASDAVTELSAKVKERTEQLARLEKLAPGAGKLKAAEKTIALWDGLAEDLAELETLTDELAAIPYDAKEAKSESKRYDELIDERTSLLAERPELAGRVARAQTRAVALREVETAGSAADAKLAVKELERQLRDGREQLAVTKSDLAHDQAHVDEVATGGPKTPCPVCKKPYGEEYDEILDGYRRRIAVNEALVPKLEESCERLERQLESAREGHDRARAAAKKLAETEGAVDAATARDHLSELERELARVDERLRALTAEIPALSSKCKANDEHAQRWHELSGTHKEKKKAVDAALKALDRSTYSEAARAKAQDSYDRALRADEEVSSLRDATADTAHLKAELGKETERAKKAKAALDVTEKELGELAFDTERLAATKEAAKQTDEAREEAQAALTQAKLEAQSRSSDVKALRNRLAESKKMQAAIAAKMTEVRQHEVAADLLSRYRDHQSRRAWPRLEQVASTLLSATTDSRYADVKLSNDYRLLVVDRGEDHELTRFSGGEQDLANLCLRLAIADWVSKERNVDLGFVVLDEVFGSQDDERRQRLLGELRALSNRFRQMLVITHLADIADLCDSHVEVVIDEPGRSSAMVA